MMRVLCIAGLVLASFTASGRLAKAAEPFSISISKAVERAVAGNADLRRERATVAQAAARQLAMEGQFDIHMDAGLERRAQWTPPLSCAPPCQELALAKSTSTTLQLGLFRQLESGGSLRLTGSASRLSSNVSMDAGLLPGTFHSSGLTLTFEHPLLRGLGTEVTQANLRKARIQQDTAQLGRQMRACNVVRDVIIAYWELAYATQDLAIKRSALALAQEQLRTTQALIAVGRLADSDAASVERAIAQRMEEVAIGEQVLFFRSLDLHRLFGEPAEARAVLFAAADAPSTTAPAMEDAAEVDRALDANPQLRALKLGRHLSEVDVATARSTLRPRLDFISSVGPVGWKPGLVDSLKQTAGLGAMAWSAGLAFEFPLQNRTARGQLRATEEDLRLANLSAEDFALQLRDMVLRTAHSLRTAAKRVALGQREVEYARLNLEAERARFQAGRATNNDVLLRQQELKDAETRLLRSTVDQNESDAALAAATAEILDRYGIVMAGP